MKLKESKLWINNTFAQIYILLGCGFAFLFSGITIDMGYVFAVLYGMLIGIFARGCKPK